MATISPKLAKLQLYRLLSHSESRWLSELSSAGLTPEGQPKAGEVLVDCGAMWRITQKLTV